MYNCCSSRNPGPEERGYDGHTPVQPGSGEGGRENAMALKITLKANERLVAGGAVIRNTSGKCELVIENNVPILREREILSEKKATTPCRRIYFIIQLMYIDEANIAEYHKTYWSLVNDVVQAAPSTITLINQINEQILAGRHYQALKIAKRLIEYEDEAMAQAARSGGG